MTADRTCATCRYWSPEVVDDARTGAPAPVMVCRRYPPAVAAWHDELVAQQPQTDPDDWCGEHVWAHPRSLAEVPTPRRPAPVPPTRELLARVQALADRLGAGTPVPDAPEDPS